MLLSHEQQETGNGMYATGWKWAESVQCDKCLTNEHFKSLNCLQCASIVQTPAELFMRSIPRSYVNCVRTAVLKQYSAQTLFVDDGFKREG